MQTGNRLSEHWPGSLEVQGKRWELTFTQSRALGTNHLSESPSSGAKRGFGQNDF